MYPILKEALRPLVGNMTVTRKGYYCDDVTKTEWYIVNLRDDDTGKKLGWRAYSVGTDEVIGGEYALATRREVLVSLDDYLAHRVYRRHLGWCYEAQS